MEEKEIKVLTIDNESQSLFGMSADMIRERLSLLLTDVNAIELEDIIKDIVSIASTKNLYTPATIVELQLRQLITISATYTGGKNIFIIPRIKHEVSKKGGKMICKHCKIGGASTHMLKFGQDILVAHASKLYNILYKDISVNIDQIIFNPISLDVVLPYKYGTQQIKESNYLNDLKSYKFTPQVYDLAKDLNNIVSINYLHNPIGDQHSGHYIYDIDIQSPKSINVINQLISYFLKYEQFYRSTDAAHIINNLFDYSLSVGGLNKFYVDTIPPYKHKQINMPEIKYDITALIPIIGAPFKYNKYATLERILSANLWDIYTKIHVLGNDSPEVQKGIEAHKNKINQRESFLAEQLKLLNMRNKMRKYLDVIESKISAAKFAKLQETIYKKNIYDADKLLELLDGNDKNIVAVEIETSIKFAEAIATNNCPHVNIYKKLRNCTYTEEIKEIIDELKSFFAKNNDKMIMCNNCKLPIICPHVIKYYELEIERASNKVVRAALEEYSMKTSYGNFCRICAESLSAKIDDDNDGGIVVHSNEDIRAQIWSEIIVLLKYFKFDKLVNTTTIINMCRDAIYPHIYEYDRQLAKSKTNSDEIIQTKRSLYIIIYAMAYFIHLINNNKVISFRKLEIKSKNPLVDMVRAAIDIVLINKNIAMRTLPNINVDIIKTNIIDAYKLLNTAQIVTNENLVTEDDTMIEEDIYYYLFHANKLDEMMSGAANTFKSADKSYNIIIPIEKSKKNQGKYIDPLINARRPKLSKLQSISNVDPLSIRGLLEFNKYFAQIYKDSFFLFFESIDNGLYDIPVYRNARSNKGETISTMTKEHKEYIEKYIKLANIERALYRRRSIFTNIIAKYLDAPETRRWVMRNVGLGRVFDESGKRHKWDIFVSDDKKEYKMNDIRNSAEFITIVDKKCSICGTYQSRTSELSDDKIRTALIANNNIVNFYKYYEHRCPKGDMHEYEDKICKKCKFQTNYYSKLYNPSADMVEIFIEFKDQYKQQILADRPQIESIEYTLPKVRDYHSIYEKWSMNFSIINTLAEKTGVDVKLILALGAAENQAQADIITGKYIPQEPRERSSVRMHHIHSHIKTILSNYNIIKNYDRINKPPKYIIEIVNNSGISKSKYAEIVKSLPDIFNDFNEHLLYVRNNMKPREIIEFCLQSFCEMLLKILEDTNKSTEQLRKLFVDYIIKKIIRSEELIMKPEQFNWAVLYNQTEVAKESYDANLIVNNDEEGEEIEDPMVSDVLDVDDDEDGEQTIRIGDEYGLD